MAPSLPVGTTAPRGLPKPEAIRWPLVAARDLFELKYGRALVEANRRPGTIAVYGTNGRCGSHDSALFKGPGVVLGRKGQGPLGVEWSDRDYWVIDTAYSLAPLRADIDLRYAYFVIKFIGLNHLKDGTSNPTLSRDTFGAQALPVPPLVHQRAIARILGALDEKIALIRRMNETLEALARAIFKSWFVDFAPVHARVEGRASGLPRMVSDVFPGAFDDSALGKIPKGWRAATVSELAEIVGGSTPSTKESAFWENGAHFWATPKDLSSLATPVLLETDRRITDLGLRQIGSGLLPPGTVLLSSRAPIGYLAVTEVPAAINQGFIAMVPRPGISNLFLLYWAEEAHQDILSRANGSTFLEISKSNFRAIPVVIPTLSVMAAFERTVRPMYSRVVNNERESRTLAHVRETLLPKLISGDVRLEHPERFLRRPI
jgi:type I restriction enzyme S subunit